uniref:Uncharacterized protein n=1 Tax=Rangifer tarandus platyrhynchus TaxID=3082113 RepID=A0ACB0FBA9_RANTA|nr:unnamed protein product [Rangifer tarandus platyrhynchus]
MATDSKCARAAEAPGRSPRGPGAGSFPLCDARLCAGLAGAAAGYPRAPLPITLCSRQDRRGAGGPGSPVPEGCGGRASGGRRGGGDARCRGQRALPSQPFWGCPWAQSRPLGNLGIQAPGAFSVEFKVRSEFWGWFCVFAFGG